MRIVIALSAVVLMNSVSNQTLAVELEPSLVISDIIAAKPLSREPPKYPIRAARKGQEGWTVVSFIVEAGWYGILADP